MDTLNVPLGLHSAIRHAQSPSTNRILLIHETGLSNFILFKAPTRGLPEASNVQSKVGRFLLNDSGAKKPQPQIRFSLTYKFQGRYFRLTDVAGNVVKKVLA